MRIDADYNIFDMIEEAAHDVLTPLIDEGAFTGSMFDVGTLARSISRKAGELMDAADDQGSGIPPGPSNIIVRTPNPLPPPKSVEDQ